MKLYNFIFENQEDQLKSILEPLAGSHEEVFAKRKEWFVKNGYKYLGQGDARYVFELSPTKVIKLVKPDPDAFKQSLAEISVFECFGSTFVPKIYAYDKKFRWIIAEKVTPFKTNEEMIEEFIKACGITNEEWNQNSPYQDKYKSMVLSMLLKQKEETKRLNDFLLKKSPWYKKFINTINRCGAKPEDLYDDNAGLASDGRFVIVDSGSFNFILEQVNSIFH